jgi:hypothetical protein
MAQPKPSKQQRDKIEVEPGADKRLASILKRALNTPPTRKQPGASDEGTKSDKTKPAR